MFKKLIAIVVLQVLLLLSAAGCGSDKQDSTAGTSDSAATTQAPHSEPSAQGVVNIYTSVPEDLINDLSGRFQQKYAQLEPKVYRAGTPDIMAKIEAEAKAGQVQADVVWVAETTAAEDLKDMKLLRVYKSQEAANIPENLKDPEGYYYGSRLINMVLAYNTKNVKTPPSTWKAFLEKDYKDRTGIPSPAASGSALYAVGSLVDHPDFGWKFFEDMRSNGGIQVKNNSEAVQKVASGEILLAVALDYQVKNLKDSGSPIDYTVPEEGLVMVVSPVALVNDSPNPAGGQVFLDYVLSSECQAYMAESQSVVPVRTDVTPPEGVPSLKDLKAAKSDAQFIKENKAQIIDKFNQIFGK